MNGDNGNTHWLVHGRDTPRSRCNTDTVTAPSSHLGWDVEVHVTIRDHRQHLRVAVVHLAKLSRNHGLHQLHATRNNNFAKTNAIKCGKNPFAQQKPLQNKHMPLPLNRHSQKRAGSAIAPLPATSTCRWIREKGAQEFRRRDPGLNRTLCAVAVLPSDTGSRSVTARGKPVSAENTSCHATHTGTTKPASHNTRSHHTRDDLHHYLSLPSGLQVTADATTPTARSGCSTGTGRRQRVLTFGRSEVSM